MIPLSVPELSGNEWKYVKECIETGWISSAGAYVGQFEQCIADYVGAAHGVACVNGSAGLHIAQVLKGVQPGDLVIIPNITFVATLNSVKYCGAEAVLIDVDPLTWQMDMGLVERFLQEECVQEENMCKHRKSNRSVAAIMPVHVLGGIGDMKKLSELSTSYNIPIIEDSTEALGSTYDSRYAGTLGDVGVFSFNGNKLISTGGGGVIVTDDEELAHKAKHVTTQSKISPDEYIHDQVGYNYRLVNVLAAIGVAQMEKIDYVLERKAEINKVYRNELRNVEGIRFQKNLENTQTNNWLFTCRLSKMREVLAVLRENSIGARPFWMPMNQLPFSNDLLYYSDVDVSAEIYKDSISLPCSSSLTENDQTRVIEIIKSIY